MGYSSQKKGYKCYDPINKKFYISRDVTFLENEPYYKNVDNKINIQEPPNIFILPQNEFPEGNSTPVQNENEIEEISQNEGEIEEIPQIGGEEEIIEETPLRRSIRTTQPSTRLRDFITYEV